MFRFCQKVPKVMLYVKKGSNNYKSDLKYRILFFFQLFLVKNRLVLKIVY